MKWDPLGASLQESPSAAELPSQRAPSSTGGSFAGTPGTPAEVQYWKEKYEAKNEELFQWMIHTGKVSAIDMFL